LSSLPPTRVQPGRSRNRLTDAESLDRLDKLNRLDDVCL
jgi:hypothetical protein